MTLNIQPIDFSEACLFIKQLHRHHRPPVGSKFQLAVNDGEKIVGVLVAGRPVARMIDNGTTLEVVRCCTDGTRNACSILYSAAWRIARNLGYNRMVTYTLPEEGGASLKASGWVFYGEAGGGDGWKTRDRANDWPLQVKWRWEVTTGETVQRFRLIKEATVEPELFAATEEDTPDA